MNKVNLATRPNPYALSDRQQAANYNYGRAMADYEGDPRYNAKQFQRAGISSSAGTAASGAARAAAAYDKNMAEAGMGRLGDAYSNASMQLDDADQRSQFGYALTGLQENAAQNDYMYGIRSAQNADAYRLQAAMTPFGSANAASLLSGLYK